MLQEFLRLFFLLGGKVSGLVHWLLRKHRHLGAGFFLLWELLLWDQIYGPHGVSQLSLEQLPWFRCVLSVYVCASKWAHHLGEERQKCHHRRIRKPGGTCLISARKSHWLSQICPFQDLRDRMIHNHSPRHYFLLKPEQLPSFQHEEIL